MASNHEIRGLERNLLHALNKDLQRICQVNGLKTGGVKAELQRRISTSLQQAYRDDPTRYSQMRNTIHNVLNRTNSSDLTAPPSSSHGNSGSSYSSGSSYHNGSQMASRGQSFGQSGFGNYQQGVGGYKNAAAPQQQALQFKDSPFYTLTQQIGDTKVCEVMSQHRNSVHVTIKVTEHPSVNQCNYDPSMRIMVFCAGEEHGLQDIAFPHQSELKVNGDEIKANLRGLKSKPGSTRPVDITNFLRLDKQSYSNNVEFTYALTNKKFFLALHLCKSVSVNELTKKIQSKRIPKHSVIQEITKAANDPDVVATSQKLSLKCPLTYMRLKVPCRSTLCSHIQCFDAESYLQLQEQGPQWICPICNKSAPFENLAVDEYVRDILENTSSSLEQVTIDPDGRWRDENATEEREAKKPRYSGVVGPSTTIDDDDDDFAIISDFSGVLNGRSAQTPSLYGMSTPTGGTNGVLKSESREPSIVPRSSGSNNKRTAEVIDLTLSSDEEDEDPIVRQPKRQNLGSNQIPSNLPYGGGYQY